MVKLNSRWAIITEYFQLIVDINRCCNRSSTDDEMAKVVLGLQEEQDDDGGEQHGRDVPVEAFSQLLKLISSSRNFKHERIQEDQPGQVGHLTMNPWFSSHLKIIPSVFGQGYPGVFLQLRTQATFC